MTSLYEYDSRARPVERGSLVLTTVHGAKGREFRHVALLDGGWDKAASDAERRLYYVAMTRAKETLMLAEFQELPNAFSNALESDSEVFRNAPNSWPAARADLQRLYVELGLRDVDISYAGRKGAGDVVHGAIARLRVGDEIGFDAIARTLRTSEGVTVGRLAKGCVLPPGQVLRVTISAIVSRTKQDVRDLQWRQGCVVEAWETVLCTLIILPDQYTGAGR